MLSVLKRGAYGQDKLQGFFFQDYVSGIIQHHCSYDSANHAVQIVGYDLTGMFGLHLRFAINISRSTSLLFLKDDLWRRAFSKLTESR